MQRQTIRIVALLGGAAVALMLLASSIADLQFRPGRFYSFMMEPLTYSGGISSAPAAGSVLQRLIAIIILGLLIYLVVALIISRQIRREMLMRLLTAFGIVILLNLFFNALRNVEPPVQEASGSLPNNDAPAEAVAEPFPTFDAQPPLWLVLLMSVIVAVVLIGLVWFFWYHRRKPAAVSTSQQIAEEAGAALRDLEAGGDLKNIVLRCYRDMSRVLSEQRGIERELSMTPREFERQLQAAGLRDEHIQRLTRLFEQVRYGPQQADPQQEREAAACLQAIVRTYGAPAS